MYLAFKERCCSTNGVSSVREDTVNAMGTCQLIVARQEFVGQGDDDTTGEFPHATHDSRILSTHDNPI